MFGWNRGLYCRKGVGLGQYDFPFIVGDVPNKYLSYPLMYFFIIRFAMMHSTSSMSILSWVCQLIASTNSWVSSFQLVFIPVSCPHVFIGINRVLFWKGSCRRGSWGSRGWNRFPSWSTSSCWSRSLARTPASCPLNLRVYLNYGRGQPLVLHQVELFQTLHFGHLAEVHLSDHQVLQDLLDDPFEIQTLVANGDLEGVRQVLVGVLHVAFE